MTLDPNVALTLASSVLSFAFFVFLIDQWRERRRPYQLIVVLGVIFLFAGFLVSIEVFREIRIPFTRRVVHARRVEA